MNPKPKIQDLSETSHEIGNPPCFGAMKNFEP